jgi:hypothetical protein
MERSGASAACSRVIRITGIGIEVIELSAALLDEVDEAQPGALAHVVDVLLIRDPDHEDIRAVEAAVRPAVQASAGRSTT